MSHASDRSLLVALTVAVSAVTAIAGMALLGLWIGALFGGGPVSAGAVAASFAVTTIALVVVLAGTVIDWMAPAVRWLRLLGLALVTPIIPVAAIAVGAVALHLAHKHTVIGFLVFTAVVIALSAAWSQTAAAMSVKRPNNCGNPEAHSAP
jgi:hypothetical protein